MTARNLLNLRRECCPRQSKKAPLSMDRYRCFGFRSNRKSPTKQNDCVKDAVVLIHMMTICIPGAHRGGSQRPRLPWGNPTVLSGAAVGHDRVRDGTGWGHRALGHEPPGSAPGMQRFGTMRGGVVTSRGGTRQKLDGWWSWKVRGPSSAISTTSLRSIASRPRVALQPGHLPGALLLLQMGILVLRRGSHLDAFSGSPVRT